MEYGELTGKQKLVFEACVKIQLGNKYVEEGHFELSNLLGEHVKEKTSKVVAHKSLKKPSHFKIEKRTNEDLEKLILNHIHYNRRCTTQNLKNTLHISDRRMDTLLTSLVKQDKIRDDKAPTATKHTWIRSGTSQAKKPERNINKVKTTGSRGGVIDITDPSIVNKTISFLNTHDWVTKGKLINHIKLSPAVSNRLLDYLVKQNLVKQVKRKNNPSHKHPPTFAQALTYWEAV